MQIGYCNHPRKNIYKEIEWIGKNGFDFVDLFLEEDRAVPEKVDSKKVKELLRKYNLGAIGHLTYYLPFGSASRILREAAIEEAKRYFKIFRGIGIKYVTVHTNWQGASFKIEQSIKFLIGSLKKLKKEAKKNNIVIMLEPIGSRENTISNIQKILKETKIPLHLDLGHANLVSKPSKFIEAFGKRIVHVHAHDNSGKEDQHLEMGKGNINWIKTIKTLKKYYDGTITLEIFSGECAVLRFKNKLKKLWEEV